MSIQEELTAELRDAIKQGDGRRRDVVRMIQTEISVARSAPGFTGEVDDVLHRKVIAAYSKKMEKARAEYDGLGDRGKEMAAKLAWEVEYLSRWLPRKLDPEATAELVKVAIADLGAAGDAKAAGRVISQIMKTHKDVVDGALVNRLVAEALSNPDQT
ncbi:MAG: GatB/YqeY domain-containing protein [Actinomycetota bacterium]